MKVLMVKVWERLPQEVYEIANTEFPSTPCVLRPVNSSVDPWGDGASLDVHTQGEGREQVPFLHIKLIFYDMIGPFWCFLIYKEYNTSNIKPFLLGPLRSLALAISQTFFFLFDICLT